MKDFLSILDLTAEDIFDLFELADRLKYDHVKPLAGKTVSMIFQKPSLRTRVSFEVGIVQLGGHPISLAQESIGLGQRESVADVARVLSRYTDMIVARVFEHTILTELAQYARVPVINALSDLSHPCQVLADAYTLRQHGKLFEGVKVAFVGDGNNVAYSWLELAMRLPIHFVLASPKGYEPNCDLLHLVRMSGVGKVELVHDAHAAVWDADVVYGDVWTSMGQEAESHKRKQDFAPYQINSELMRYAKPDAIFMHCLPAHRGEEVTDEVIDSPQSVVFDEAENRLHVQKAIMTKLVEHHYAPVSSSIPKAQTKLKKKR